ncbi:MAG: NB-ARC domain-containing protein [Pseudanabaenales cyanobacterium]|nr:NB-ARC domain-containing protein [Pseudanabaenales cyanobacterium]
MKYKSKKSRRSRGVTLTYKGLRKLQIAKRELENQENYGHKYTLEKLSERAELTSRTITKVISCQGRVDKRTLYNLFIALSLELEESDYTQGEREDPKEDDIDYSRQDSHNHQDWQEIVSVSNFYGRKEELRTLEKWILVERCHLVTIMGMGGVGKTSLAAKLANQIQGNFEYVLWRSLQDAPHIEILLENIAQFLFQVQEIKTHLSDGLYGKMFQLIDCLQSHRCLLLFDSIESVLCSSTRVGQYREGYEGYGEFLRRIGLCVNQSCIVLTTREKPKEVASLEGDKLPVRSLRLYGVNDVEGRKILKTKSLSASNDEVRILVKRYAGNPLALKIAATTICNVFDNNVSEFLKQGTTVFGDIRELLDEQFERLPDLEKEIVYWLSVKCRPCLLLEMQDQIFWPTQKSTLLERLDSLSRRSLIEVNADGFSLQPLVAEYINSQLVEQTCEEITTQQFSILKRYMLVEDEAEDYIRQYQTEHMLRPIIDYLLVRLGGKNNTAKHFEELLKEACAVPALESGYITENINNLIMYLGSDCECKGLS